MAETDDWTPIESSFLKAHKYDPNSRRLVVEYHDGKRYEHLDVPAEKHASMIGAQSAGAYYNSKIKDHHPGRKL